MCGGVLAGADAVMAAADAGRTSGAPSTSATCRWCAEPHVLHCALLAGWTCCRAAKQGAHVSPARCGRLYGRRASVAGLPWRMLGAAGTAAEATVRTAAGAAATEGAATAHPVATALPATTSASHIATLCSCCWARSHYSSPSGGLSHGGSVFRNSDTGCHAVAEHLLPFTSS